MIFKWNLEIVIAKAFLKMLMGHNYGLFHFIFKPICILSEN